VDNWGHKTRAEEETFASKSNEIKLLLLTSCGKPMKGCNVTDAEETLNPKNTLGHVSKYSHVAK
jgi:hypothetical protein